MNESLEAAVVICETEQSWRQSVVSGDAQFSAEDGIRFRRHFRWVADVIDALRANSPLGVGPERLTLSMMSQVVALAAYQTIIAEGKANPGPWLSLILRELEERSAPWYEALKAIAGTSPVTPEEKGHPRLVQKAWLRWGRENGLLPRAA